MFFTDSYQALRRGERLLALRYAVISVLVLILIGLLVGFFMLRRFESAVIFHPERAPWSGTWNVPAGGEDVWFQVASGERLHGWYFRTAKQPAAATVIYFHGNGGNLSYVGWVGEKLSRRGFDVLLFDYRGYGRSEGEVSDERGLYEDAEAAYDFVLKERGARPERIVLHGQSLGTTAVADLAGRKKCGAIILESGLSSASDMAGVVLPWLPRFLRGVTRNKLDSVRKLPNVRCPVLVIHGESDEVIPIAQGRALYDAAPEPKKLLIVKGAGHNNLSMVGGSSYLDALSEFIEGAILPSAEE